MAYKQEAWHGWWRWRGDKATKKDVNVSKIYRFLNEMSCLFCSEIQLLHQKMYNAYMMINRR